MYMLKKLNARLIFNGFAEVKMESAMLTLNRN